MSELRFEWKNMLAADLGEESCVPDLLGERILQNSLKFYLDETDEIYEGYGKVADSYPYRQRNNYKRQLKEKQIRTAVLENNQLKAVFLPDYGGRLWELWDKNENRNLLYTNDGTKCLVFGRRGMESWHYRTSAVYDRTIICCRDTYR